MDGYIYKKIGKVFGISKMRAWQIVKRYEERGIWKIKEIKIGKMFTIDETPTYPKLRIENGYVDMRDEIVKTVLIY